MSPEPHIAGTEVEDIDALFTELAKLEVEIPPWSAVVDRIAAAPAPTRPRFAFGWSAVLAGAAVALAVGVAGAVSEPVRETVFEPVANLLPWVDDGSDEAPVPTDPSPAAGDEREPTDGGDPAPGVPDTPRDGPGDRTDRTDDGDRTGGDEQDRIQIDEREAEPVPTTTAPSDRLTDREERRRRLEQRRRELEQQRRDAAQDSDPSPITTVVDPAPATTDEPADGVVREEGPS